MKSSYLQDRKKYLIDWQLDKSYEFYNINTSDGKRKRYLDNGTITQEMQMRSLQDFITEDIDISSDAKNKVINLTDPVIKPEHDWVSVFPSYINLDLLSQRELSSLKEQGLTKRVIDFIKLANELSNIIADDIYITTTNPEAITQQPNKSFMMMQIKGFYQRQALNPYYLIMNMDMIIDYDIVSQRLDDNISSGFHDVFNRGMAMSLHGPYHKGQRQVEYYNDDQDHDMQVQNFLMRNVLGYDGPIDYKANMVHGQGAIKSIFKCKTVSCVVAQSSRTIPLVLTTIFLAILL